MGHQVKCEEDTERRAHKVQETAKGSCVKRVVKSEIEETRSKTEKDCCMRKAHSTLPTVYKHTTALTDKLFIKLCLTPILMEK